MDGGPIDFQTVKRANPLTFKLSVCPRIQVNGESKQVDQTKGQWANSKLVGSTKFSSLSCHLTLMIISLL